MRSQNNNRNNRSRSGNSNRNGNGDRAQAYAGRNYNSQAYNYNDYDREYNDGDRDYNAYDRSESDRYSNYEGNSGRGNYENSYDNDRGYSSRNTSGRNYNSGNYNNSNNRSSGGGYNGGSGYTTGPRRTWDSQEPGYYNRQNDDHELSHYGGTRRRDEKDWSGGDGRNYAAEYDNTGNYRRDDDRGFFGRVGDSIRNTWHDITDRDDTQENMRRFKESSSGNTYNNRGNYHPYPEGSSDNQYGSSTWARNNNRGTYGERRNDYGGYGLDRQDFNW